MFYVLGNTTNAQRRRGIRSEYHLLPAKENYWGISVRLSTATPAKKLFFHIEGARVLRP